MRRIVSGLFVAGCLLTAVTLEAKDQIAESVVKVHVTKREPDLLRPWTKGTSQETSGSGVVIEGKRILTNAHVVLYAAQIFVQGNQTTDRIPATVAAISPEMDLAVLKVEKASFFEGRSPVPLEPGIPPIRQGVSVYGYPIGGEQQSVTQGIISRIEYAGMYCFASGVRIQIDAALNPGNSGGPAVSNGKLVGLVFSKISKAENIGYLIAVDEIQTFLKDVEDGVYNGKPALWDEFQTAENTSLRKRLGLSSETGVMVTKPYQSTPDYPLKAWDLVTRVAGEPLDNKGNVKVKDDLRLPFSYLVAKQAKNGKIRLTILRDKKSLEVEVPVAAERKLVLPFLKGSYPRYFICGPMVFLTASQDVVTRLPAGMLVYMKNPLLGRVMDDQAFDGEEIVLLGASLLPHAVAEGYGPHPLAVVQKVNGVSVKNLTHLVELLRDATDPFLTFQFGGSAEIIVFQREEFFKSTEDILSDEGIRKQYSDDLGAVWKKKK
jgi:S1-C subfamily serine protease